MSNLDTLKIKNRVKQKLTKYVIIYLRKYTASAPGRKGLHMSAIDAQIIQTFRTLGTEEKRLFLSAFEAALAKQASPALSHPSPEDENRQDVSNLDTSLALFMTDPASCITLGQQFSFRGVRGCVVVRSDLFHLATGGIMNLHRAGVEHTLCLGFLLIRIVVCVEIVSIPRISTAG